MPACPTLTLCDALVAKLLEAWAPSAPSGAERAYYKRVWDAEAATNKLQGRRVIFYPTDYDSDPETRGEDAWAHRITVQVVERFDGDGDPSVGWMDERVNWVFEYIVSAFDFGPQPPEWNKRLRTSGRQILLYDVTKLKAGKLFFSQVEFEFEELLPA